LDHFQDVRAVQEHLVARGERSQQAAQDQGGVDVQPGKRLVQDEQLGIVQQGGQQQDLLAHALGIAGQRGVAVFPEPGQVEQLVRLRLQHPAGQAAQAAD